MSISSPAGTRPRVQSNLALPGYLVLAALVVAFYLWFAFAQNGDFGFPLDDAWIHQVYARNLGTHLEFSFFEGQPSAGSTSPLWAMLLAVGYAVRADYRIWTLGLGVVFLAASGWMAGRVMWRLLPESHIVHALAPLFLILEWHMVWAAASGMEILLFVFLALALVDRFLGAAAVPVSDAAQGRGGLASWFEIGLLSGLLTLTRPDGVILVALVGLGLVYAQRKTLFTAQTLLSFAAFALAFLVLLVPYLWFNLQTSGTLLPNTFYAKGAEYAELTANTNFIVRWLALYRQPLIGAQQLLIPGLVYGVYHFARARQWLLLVPAVWLLALPAFYAWRLPVEYQFGRYMMPIIPFIVVYGLVGTALLFQRIPMRIVRRTCSMTMAVLLVAFLVLGLGSYTQSVAVINCEMVAMANFTRQNVEEGDLIAVHDIGAQGYFDNHPMLDMAGLVSPEVIPFIRDETRLRAWMRERNVKFAIFFPTWYPQLAKDVSLVEIFDTACPTTRQAGEENLRLYVVE